MNDELIPIAIPSSLGIDNRVLAYESVCGFVSSFESVASNCFGYVRGWSPKFSPSEANPSWMRLFRIPIPSFRRTKKVFGMN